MNKEYFTQTLKMIPKESHIECPYDELKERILPLLRGRVFHVRSLIGYENILAIGKIRNNKRAQFKFSYPQSVNSYGRLNGWICLCDLRNVEKNLLEESLRKYNFLNPRSANNNPVFLFISKKVYNDLIPWTEAHENARGKMYVPYIECWYPGDIFIRHITGALILRVIPDPRKERYERLVEEARKEAL